MSFSRSGAGAQTRVEPLKRGTQAQRMQMASGVHRTRRAGEQLESGLEELSTMSSGVLEDIASLQALVAEQGMDGGQPTASVTSAPRQRQDAAARARAKAETGTSFVDVLAKAATVMSTKDRGARAVARGRGRGRSRDRGSSRAEPGARPVPTAEVTRAEPDVDYGAQLKRFKELLDSELISQADYERQKEMVLARMGGVPAHAGVVNTAAERAKDARVAQTKAAIDSAVQSAPRSARRVAEVASSDDALEQRRLEQKREKEKMVARLTQMGLGNAKDGFVPQLEPEPSHQPARPPENTLRATGQVASSPVVCVCGLKPCVCGGDSDGSSSEDAAASDSEESLKTDSDWEDDPQPRRVQPPRPPPQPGDGTEGNVTARSGGYSTRMSGSAQAPSNDNVLESAYTGNVSGNMRPGQLRNVYRESVQSQQMGASASAPTGMPGKLRSSAGGHPTMPQFGSARTTTPSGSTRGPRPPGHQSFAGSFGRPRPAGVPRMQSFIFPKSKTAPDLSVMAAQQRAAFQDIAASVGLDLSVGTAPPPPSGGPTGPATPVRMASHMSFGRPRPHGVPKKSEPEPEPEPEPSAAPPRSILKMPTDASFDANQIRRGEHNTEEYHNSAGSPSRSRSRSRRSRSQSHERSRSRPRERGTRVLSARSRGSRSSRRTRRREFSDEDFSGEDYSDYYSSDDGYSSAGSARSYESRRSSTHGRDTGRSRRRDAPRYHNDMERGESTSKHRRSPRSTSRGMYIDVNDQSDSDREEQRRRETRRRQRKERRYARRKLRQQENAVHKFQEVEETAAEAAALKLARKAARKAEKARKEEQRALATARAAADSRQMAAAEAEREAEEAAQRAELEAAVAADRQAATVMTSRQEAYEWTARQSDGQRSARDAKKERDRKLNDKLMQQVPAEEAWIFGREL